MKNPYVRVIALCTIQILILAGLFKAGIQEYIRSSNTYVFALSSIVGSLIAIAATWLFYRLVDRKPLSTMKLSMNRKQTQFSIASFVITVGLFFLATMLMETSGIVSVQFNNHFFFDLNVKPMFLISAVSWFLVGFNEELMYRGYMVANLNHISITKLFFVSSVYFAISHIFVNGLNPIMLVVTLSAAITLMYVYLKTGSLIAATVPHFIYDFLTRQLIGNSDISILVINGTPSDVYYAVLHLLFLVIQVLLAIILFKEKLTICFNNFKNNGKGVKDGIYK